jgi:hypothetical protein
LKIKFGISENKIISFENKNVIELVLPRNTGHLSIGEQKER